MWGRAFTIARLAGFDIKVDASWFLIVALIVWSLSTGYFPQSLPDARPSLLLTLAVLAALGVFASLVLHELAHALVARHFGLEIEGITLFLFGGVAELRSEPADPQVELLVAIVGPLASLALAGLFWSSDLAGRGLGAGTPTLALLGYLAAINLILALFNLVPAFPLDGGRVFRALLWKQSGDLLGATRRAAGVSALFAWGLVVLGVLTLFAGGLAAGLWPILIGLFLLALARGAEAQVETKHALQGRTVADLMRRQPITVGPEMTLLEVVDTVFLIHGISFAPVIERGVLLGYVDLHLIRRIDREHWGTAKVEDVLESLSEDCAIGPDLPAEALLTRMTRTGRRKFLVVEGRFLVGVVTLTDVSSHLDISRQIARPG